MEIMQLHDSLASSRHSVLQGITPEALEGILLWQNSAYTFKVFAGGLYALICLRQLVNGRHL